MDPYSFGADVGAGISDRLCNIYELFPDSVRPEAHTSYPCQHVQLHPADHSYGHQHHPGYGHPDMAESPCCPHGLCRRLCRQPQPSKSINRLHHMTQAIQLDLLIFSVLDFTLSILIPALDLDVIDRHRAECTDECCRKTCISDERNIEIHSGTTYVVSVGQLSV